MKKLLSNDKFYQIVLVLLCGSTSYLGAVIMLVVGMMASSDDNWPLEKGIYIPTRDMFFMSFAAFTLIPIVAFGFSSLDMFKHLHVILQAYVLAIARSHAFPHNCILLASAALAFLFGYFIVRDRRPQAVYRHFEKIC